MSAPGGAVRVDWTLPPGRVDWLTGSGATRGEQAAVWAVALAALGVVVAAAQREGTAWSWWQWLLVGALVLDVVGGVVANALGTAKRLYHGPVPAGAGPVGRFVHHHVRFTALHVHPLVLVPLLPGATLTWALTWYVTCLAGVALVTRLPLHLQRPAALGVLAIALVLAPVVAAPDSLAWFGPVLVAKLVVAHAVREEPYRPMR
jgi:hypothetical protein